MKKFIKSICATALVATLALQAVDYRKPCCKDKENCPVFRVLLMPSYSMSMSLRS